MKAKKTEYSNDSLITMGYVDLSIAIVQQAAEDYRRAYKRYLLRGIRSERLDELEEFFTSNHGKLCCLGMNKKILAEIRREVEASNHDYCIVGRPITYRGKTQNIIDWSKELGIKYKTLLKRFIRGWSDEEALSTPLGGKRGVYDETI